LGKEGIIVVRPIYKVTGLEAANSAEREVSVRSQILATRVLGNARGQQREIGEASPIQRQTEDRTFVNDGS